MAALIILLFVAFIAYTANKSHSYDNCNAHDVDWNKMTKDQSFISQKEMEKRYKSGYYNKK